MRSFIFIFFALKISLYAGVETKLTILFTNNINGNFENCLCNDHPLGSLEKMKVVIDSLRKSNENTLLLDAGDFSSPFGDQLRDEYLYQIGNLMNYDVMAIGDQEFSDGVEFFLSNSAKNPLPFMSSNLKIKRKEVFPTHLIRQIGKIRVLIIPVLFPDVFKFYEEEKITGIEITNPVETIRTLINQNSSDLVILLSHNGLDNDQALAEKIPGVRFIIGAHTQNYLQQPINVNQTMIFQAGSDGFYLGKIDVIFAGAQLKSFIYETIPMELDLPNDPAVTKIIKKYHFEKNRPVITKIGYLTPVDSEFVIKSAEACRECHAEQYQHWRSTRHAQSYSAIEKEGKTKLLKCQSCHVSGFGREDGFVNLNITPGLGSVSCTECHYTRAEHETNPRKIKTFKIVPGTCVRCHNSENDADFNFDREFQQVTHRINRTKIID